MIKYPLAAAIFTLTLGAAVAQTTPSSGPSTVITPRGPALVTGRPGSMESVMIPGSPVAGSLMNNGNGSSTLFIPGRPSEVVITPQ